MTAPTEPLDYADSRAGMKALAQQRRQAREQLERAYADLADAEREYRKSRAQAYVVVEAETAGERDAQVDAKTADMRFARDIAKGMLKGAEERLAEIDAERASLHKLVDWSSRLPAGSEPEPRSLSNRQVA